MTYINRRHMVLATLSAAGGLAIGVPAQAVVMGPTAWDTKLPAGATEVTAWVVIEPDETVLIRVAKQEMGQGY